MNLIMYNFATAAHFWNARTLHLCNGSIECVGNLNLTVCGKTGIIQYILYAFHGVLMRFQALFRYSRCFNAMCDCSRFVCSVLIDRPYK